MYKNTYFFYKKIYNFINNSNNQHIFIRLFFINLDNLNNFNKKMITHTKQN